MTNQSRPWKQNLLKIPPSILAKAKALSSDLCVVACTRKILVSEIVSGRYSHLGIQLTDGVPVFPEQFVPNPANGRYSKSNVDGKVKRLTDQPKVQHTYSFDTPNYGDWSKGSHEVGFTRDVFQTHYTPPRELSLTIKLIGEEVQAQAYVFKFAVEEVLDRTAPDFLEKLLDDLNLVQENVGSHGLFPSDATMADFLGTLYVNWEILPPGEREKNISTILKVAKVLTPQVRQRLIQRYDFLTTLKPLKYVCGSNGFRYYFGALFAQDLVVFENVDYGNSIYVMFEDWNTLSQKSRTELLSKHPDDIIRIPHIGDWRDRLRTTVETQLSQRRQAVKGKQT